MDDWISSVTHIEVDAEPRYWEDAIVDGVVDKDGSRIPGRMGDAWKVRIDLAAGRVEDWPEGVVAAIHYKVCDQGLYWLTDTNGRRLARWTGVYVPTSFLNHEGGGSDYVTMKVGPDGVIEGYRDARVDGERWEIVPHTL